jgi:hypothetical protein
LIYLFKKTWMTGKNVIWIYIKKIQDDIFFFDIKTEILWIDLGFMT